MMQKEMKNNDDDFKNDIFRNKITIDYFLKPKPYNINNNEREIKQRVKRAFPRRENNMENR
jgi:hypothetical protein